MSWEFITIVRKVYQGDNNWGQLYLKTEQGGWEYLCYTYELPWNLWGYGETYKGKAATPGTTRNEKSKVKLGYYELTVKTHGNKGWRLELKNTGHRKWVQIHRAHKSMYIEGCILPVPFNNLTSSGFQKGQTAVQTESEALMAQIKTRYDLLKVTDEYKNAGNAALVIAAVLPAELQKKRITAVV